MHNQREIKTLIKNKDFRNQPEKIKRHIISIIGSYDSSLNSMSYALDVATNKNAIESGHIIELVKIIIQTKGDNQVKYASYVATNKNAIASGNVVESTKMISESEKDGEHLSFAYYAAVNKYINRTGEVVKIVKSILEAPDEKTAEKIYNDYLLSALNINSLDALNKGIFSEIGFWDLFLVDDEKAMQLLALSMLPQSAIEEYGFTELSDYTELANNYVLDNQQDNIPLDIQTMIHMARTTEMSPNAKIRRKNK